MQINLRVNIYPARGVFFGKWLGYSEKCNPSLGLTWIRNYSYYVTCNRTKKNYKFPELVNENKVQGEFFIMHIWLHWNNTKNPLPLFLSLFPSPSPTPSHSPPPLSLSLSLSIYLSIYLYLYLSLSLSICLSVLFNDNDNFLKTSLPDG